MVTNISTQPQPEPESDLRMEPLWTVEDVACYLRLTAETVRVMARRGELPSIKVGKRVWRFKINDIKNWLGSCHDVVGENADQSIVLGG